MEFNYYYGTQADQFSFIRIPRVILTDKLFSNLSLQAKVLYGLLLDRMGLSMKNGWFDRENRVYIIYQIAEIQEDLGFSKKKAIDYLAELEIFGLIEKKRRGLGLASIIYVKSFMVESTIMEENKEETIIYETSRSVALGTSEKEEVSKRKQEIFEGTMSTCEEHTIKMQEKPIELIEYRRENPRSIDSGTSRSVDLGTSGSVKTAPQEVSVQEPLEVPRKAPLNNYNNKNNNYWSNNKSNHILSGHDSVGYDTTLPYPEIIKENIGLDILCQRNPHMQELIRGIYDLILETVLCQNETILIASNHYPASLVRSKFLRLDSSHVEYVLECLRGNTTKVKNIKKYLLAALFNAPTTIDGYYQAEVNYDMPQYASGR